MKLCFITHDVQLYGANTSLLVLLRYLLRTHPDILLKVIVPGKGDFTVALEKEGIPHQVVSFERSVYAVDRQNGFSRIRLGLQFLTGTWRLYRCIRKLRPDVIYTNSSVITHGLVIAKALGVPHIWHIREFGRDDYGLLPIWGSRIQTWLYRKSAKLIFNSRALLEAACDPAMTSNAEVVYNGVEAPVGRPEDIAPRGDLFTECTLCYLGFLSKQKNVTEAVELLHHISEERPNAVLHICGSGHASVEQKCKELAVRRGLQDQVIFHGRIDDIGEMLSVSHFLVMPSFKEAMGRVTAEALMHGVPVIGRNSAGTAELFEDGVHGIHYTDVAEAASRVQALSQEAYDAMCSQAKAHAAETFSVEAYGEQILQIIEEQCLV